LLTISFGQQDKMRIRWHRGLPAWVGVYVDVENVARNGGRGMRFAALRDYDCREGAEAIRLNAYRRHRR
jgi:hypothetical protein